MSMRQRLRRILHQYKCCICSSSQHSCRRQIAGRLNIGIFSWSDACNQSPSILDWQPACCCERQCATCLTQMVLPSSPQPHGRAVEWWMLFLFMNEHNLALFTTLLGKKDFLQRLLQSAAGQDLLALCYRTLNATCCNTGKRTRELNRVGRRKRGWISELLQTGVRGKCYCFDEGESQSWGIS